MKVFITVLFLMAVMPHYSWGQSTCPRIEFTYDNAGNRVKRQYVVCFAGNDDDVAALRAVVKDNKPLQNWQVSKSSLKAFPNPSNGVFKVIVENPQSNGVLELYDFTGRKMTTEAVVTGLIPMNASNMAVGAYMLIYRDADKVLGQLKVIIE